MRMGRPSGCDHSTEHGCGCGVLRHNERMDRSAQGGLLHCFGFPSDHGLVVESKMVGNKRSGPLRYTQPHSPPRCCPHPLKTSANSRSRPLTRAGTTWCLTVTPLTASTRAESVARQCGGRVINQKSPGGHTSSSRGCALLVTSVAPSYRSSRRPLFAVFSKKYSDPQNSNDRG